jgi:hypothetical protein
MPNRNPGEFTVWNCVCASVLACGVQLFTADSTGRRSVPGWMGCDC